MPAKPRRTKILPRNRPKAASATAPTAHTSEAIVRTREGARKSKDSAPAAQAMNSAAIKLPKAIKTKRTAHMNKRSPRPRGEEDRTALGIQRLRFLFILSAVDSKPASDGRIKTSHFFSFKPRGDV